MFIKVYEKVLEYIKKEYKFLITLVVTLLLFTIKLPYYIDMPGGIINISDRIIINNDQKTSGTFNFAYVSEIKATLPTYAIALINPNWDLLKKEEVILQNETEDETKFTDKINMQESVSNSLYMGFKEAGKDFKIKNNKIYVTHIYENAKTDIKIGDQIIKIDDKEIKTKEDLKFLNNENEGKEITIKVINNKKEYTRTAKLVTIDDKSIIGITIGETFDIESEYDVKIKYKERESGPSGGMMMALSVYSKLTNTDLTNGKKIVGTGTIDTYGNVGEIGGVKYKLIGAVKNKADIFLVPNGKNYEEAMKIKQEKKYDIKIIGVSTLKDAIKELTNINQE